MKTWLLDTGPLVAYLDASDAAHQKVAGRVDSLTGTLATTGAVVTEAMYFVSTTPGGPAALAAFASASGMRIYDLSQPTELIAAAELMERLATRLWTMRTRVWCCSPKLSLCRIS